MAEEDEQATTVLRIAAPELLQAVAAATGDAGAARRNLRATCSQLRALLPASFPGPLVITLSGDGDAAAAAGQPSDVTAEAAAASTAAATAAQLSAAAGAALKLSPWQLEAQSRQCDWPLLQLWQQYQQQDKRELMLLPDVHLNLGPGLPWVAGTSDLPELLLPHCSLLQQQEFLQQVTSLNVTYAHAVAIDEGSSSEQDLPQKCSPSSAAAGSCPASSVAASLLSSRAGIASFSLGPWDKSSAAPCWAPVNQLLHSSSSSSSTLKWHMPGPCAVPCPNYADLTGAAVLGRQWLPHLLQLPKLKHLALPVLWAVNNLPQAQHLAALRADLAAAAAAATCIAEGDGRPTTSSSSSSGSAASLEVLQLLLVPRRVQRGVRCLQALMLEAPASTFSVEWRPELLQQLLQALVLELPRLQRIQLCVLGHVAGPWDSLGQVAISLGKQSSNLRSFSLVELSGMDGLHKLELAGATWDCRSSGGLNAVQGCMSLPSEQQQQQRHGQLRELALKYRDNPAHFPTLDSGFVSNVTQLQLAVPQTLLPHLAFLVPDGAAVFNRDSSSSRLWRDLECLELCLDGGRLDGRSAEQLWDIPAPDEQRHALQLLLRTSRRLRVLRLQSSTQAGVNVLGLLAPIAAAAAATLEELHLLHSLPQLLDVGSIPFLHEFRQLRRLTLASPTLQMKALMLHTLPPSLRQLHLERLAISCELAAGAYRQGYISTAQAYNTNLHRALQEALETEDVQPGQPVAAAAASGTATVDRKTAAAAAAVAAAAGDYVPAVMHPQFEQFRAWVRPRLVDAMPQLQRLHLFNCWFPSQTVCLQLLLQWAGPCLQELVLAELRCNNLKAATADAYPESVPLPRLRKFHWVKCNLPMEFGGAEVSMSQLLTLLQASAPQLQQLKVAGGEKQPLLDWHVPLLLRMQQLRRLELFAGADVAGELAARFAQLQQLAGAGTMAAAGAAPTPQEQQLPAVLAAVQNMQLHVLQAARFAQQVQQLTAGHVPPVDEEFGDDPPESDEDSGDDAASEIMRRALGYATSLLGSEGFSDLAGMSAAAAAQLQQGLPAGRCGAVVLHRDWDDAVGAEGECMYPPHKDEW